MSAEILSQLTHEFVGWLLAPILFLLMVAVAVAIWEAGISVSERFWVLPRLHRTGRPGAVTQLGRRRIERADLLARIGPMLGLMGTLIPLGPGLAALGRGELEVLADAVTVAFDTTVMGLLTGIVGFILARLRRRWYDNVLDALEESVTPPEPGSSPATSQETVR
ncbi:MAG: MotA/TolQ/ExbB proton channel family protein [Pseudomonadota bacterium]